MKTRTLHIGGNAGAAAGRDIHIHTLNIGGCTPATHPPPDTENSDTQSQISSLMADFAASNNGGQPLSALTSRQLQAMTDYRLRLESLVKSAAHTPKIKNK